MQIHSWSIHLIMMKSITLVEIDAYTDINLMEGALKDKPVRETVRGAGDCSNKNDANVPLHLWHYHSQLTTKVFLLNLITVNGVTIRNVLQAGDGSFEKDGFRCRQECVLKSVENIQLIIWCLRRRESGFGCDELMKKLWLSDSEAIVRNWDPWKGLSYGVLSPVT